MESHAFCRLLLCLWICRFGFLETGKTKHGAGSKRRHRREYIVYRLQQILKEGPIWKLNTTCLTASDLTRTCLTASWLKKNPKNSQQTKNDNYLPLQTVDHAPLTAAPHGLSQTALHLRVGDGVHGAGCLRGMGPSDVFVWRFPPLGFAFVFSKSFFS